MTTISKLIGVLCFSFILFLSSCSDDDGDDLVLPVAQDIMTSDDLTNYFNEIANSDDVPGFTINIVSNENLVYQKAVGYANIKDQIPFTNETMTNIASISKTFIGAAVAKAIEQGYFTMETPINELLPFNVINSKMPEAIIKVKHLVTHTSGIIDIPENYIKGSYFFLPGQNLNTSTAKYINEATGISESVPVTLSNFIEKFFLPQGEYYSEDSFINAPPGEVWQYSNNGASLMAYIIEVVSGQSYDDYVKTTILDPLQMNSTAYSILDVDLNEMAIPYLNSTSEVPFYGNNGYPEGSIHTSNKDIGKYLLNMAQGVQGKTTQLFGTASYDLLFTSQLESNITPSLFADNHSLFWYKKGGEWMHGGNNIGMSTHMVIEENGKYAYSILTNMDGTFYENETKWETVKNKIEEGIATFISNNQ